MKDLERLRTIFIDEKIYLKKSILWWFGFYRKRIRELEYQINILDILILSVYEFFGRTIDGYAEILKRNDKKTDDLNNEIDNLKALLVSSDAEIKRLKDKLKDQCELFICVERNLTRGNFRETQDSKVKMMLRDVDGVISDYRAGEI